jgi:hypothetical protein
MEGQLQESLVNNSTSNTSKCFSFTLKDNSISRLMSGADLHSETLDGAVNALALICALVLTIPYGLMSSMSTEFWDNIEKISADCEEYDANTMSGTMYSAIRATIFPSTGGLITSTFYYLLKPIKLLPWWPRGRFFLLLLFILTSTSVISLIVTSNVYIGVTGFTSDNYCTSTSAAIITLSIFLVAIFIISIILFI